MKIINTLFLCLFALSQAIALTLTGTVSDYTTGLPVQGATVSVYGRPDIAADVTNAQGVYHLPPLPVAAGNYRQTLESFSSGNKICASKLYDLRGRNISGDAVMADGRNKFLPRMVRAGCYILASDRALSGKVVVIDMQRSDRIRQKPAISAAMLSKTVADGDSSGRVMAAKNGYLSAIQNFVRPADTLPPLRLLQREQPLGSCGGALIESALFALTGVDTMTVFHPEMIDTINYCDNNDILQTVYASTPAKTTANRISVLTSTRLELDNDPSSAVTIDEDNNGVPEAIVLGASSWVRPSGSDVEGVWQFAGYTYRAISGSLTNLQQVAFNIEDDLNSTRDLIRRLCMTVSGSSVSFSQSPDGDREVNADHYFVTTGSVMRDRLDGTALRADDSTVFFIGNRTSDTVAVVVTMENGRRFHCLNSNPQLTDYEYDGNPSVCPNRSLPPWWGDFITANENDFYRGLGKAASFEQLSRANDAPVGVVRRILK